MYTPYTGRERPIFVPFPRFKDISYTGKERPTFPRFKDIAYIGKERPIFVPFLCFNDNDM